MHPHQVISLEDLPGETSFALADHYDHVHVGYHPTRGRHRSAVRGAAETGPVAAPDQPPRPDRKPRGADQPLEVRAAGQHDGNRGGDCSAAPSGENLTLPSYSDSPSSTSPARCRWPTGATWRARRRGGAESVLVLQTLGAPPPPAAGAGAGRARPRPGRAGAAAADPGDRDPRLRSASRTRRRRRAGSTRPPRPRTPPTSSSTTGSPCSTAPCTPRRSPAPTRSSRSELDAGGGRAVRIGYGSGEEIADGRFTRRPRRSTSAQRRLAPAAPRGGPAAAGTGRGDARRPRAGSTPARPCCCAPAPTSTPAATARRRCSCGSASRRCWSS